MLVQATLIPATGLFGHSNSLNSFCIFLSYSGALIVTGGIGISENVRAGNNVSAGNDITCASRMRAQGGFASTSITSGSLIVTGGCGMSGDLNIGGYANITDYINVQGAATFANPPTWTLGSGTLIYAVNDTAIPSADTLNVSSIPSWVRRITIQLDGLRQQTTSARPRLQVGTTTLFTTGINGAIWGNNAAADIQFTSGLIYLWNSTWSGASKAISGEIKITRMASSTLNPNNYTIAITMSDDANPYVAVGSGTIATASNVPLQQFSILSGGTGINFTAGRYSVIYE